MFEGQGLGEDDMAEATDINEIALREVTVPQRAGARSREPLDASSSEADQRSSTNRGA